MSSRAHARPGQASPRLAWPTVLFLLATNLLTVRALHASANLRPRPDRRATLAFDTYLGENSLAARRISDYHISTARFELGASSALAQELWWSAARTEGRYPNRHALVPAVQA